MSKQQSYKHNFIAWLFAINLAIFLLLGLLGKRLFIDEVPLYWTVGTLLFLLAYEWMTIVIVNKKVKTIRPQQVVNLYMLLKVVKFFIFLAVVGVYVFAVEVELKRFVLVSVALYMVYLLLDTLFLVSVEKRMKKL
jgi:hypothetical protein